MLHKVDYDRSDVSALLEWCDYAIARCVIKEMVRSGVLLFDGYGSRYDAVAVYEIADLGTRALYALQILCV